MEALVILICIFLVIFLVWYNSPSSINVTPAPNQKVNSILIWQKYTTYFHVAGTQYHDFDLAKKHRLIKEHSSYSWKREPNNRHDKNAIAIYINDYKVGYVPSFEAKKLVAQIDRGDKFILYLNDYKPRSQYEALEIEAINETLKAQLDPTGEHHNRVSNSE